MLTGVRCHAAQSGRGGPAGHLAVWNDGVQALLFDPNKLAPTYPASLVLKPPKFNAYYDRHGREARERDGLAPRTYRGRSRRNGRGPWLRSRALPQREMIIKHIRRRRLGTISANGPAFPLAQLPGSGLALICAPKYVAFKTADDYPSSIDMATALHPQTLLATQYAGRDLGRPVRLSAAGCACRRSSATKIPSGSPAIEVTDTYSGGFWETLGFPWFAGL